MKKLSTSEMRNVTGAYRVICKGCKKDLCTISKVIVTAFFTAHSIKCGKKYVMWDTRYKNADKWST